MRKILLNIFLISLITFSSTLALQCNAEDKDTEKNEATKTQTVEEDKGMTAEEMKNYEAKCSSVDALDLVEAPDKYLDKFVSIKGVFDKYTTLGLDYKPAMKTSKDYISFLINRPNVKSKKNVIPLSELKLIIARKTAEKYTNLETSDKITIYGQVFSKALNDPWIDVNHITSTAKDITEAPKSDEKQE